MGVEAVTDEEVCASLFARDVRDRLCYSTDTRRWWLHDGKCWRCVNRHKAGWLVGEFLREHRQAVAATLKDDGLRDSVLRGVAMVWRCERIAAIARNGLAISGRVSKAT